MTDKTPITPNDVLNSLAKEWGIGAKPAGKPVAQVEQGGPGMTEKAALTAKFAAVIRRKENGWVVDGDLDLSGSGVVRLPNNLHVTRDLNVSNTPIAFLPARLSVGRHANLSHTKIDFLPDGFSVGGDLDVRATRVKEVPKTVKVGGKLIEDEKPPGPSPAEVFFNIAFDKELVPSDEARIKHKKQQRDLNQMFKQWRADS